MRKWIVGLALLGVVKGLTAQESFSLAQAKQYALENHLRIANAEYDTENAIMRKNETRGIGLPQVDINGTFNMFFNLPVQVVDGAFIQQPGTLVSFRAGTDFSSGATLQVGQLIFNGSYIVGLQVAKQYVDFQRTFEDQTKEDVVFNVIQAYQMLAIASDNVIFMDSLVQITEDLFNQQEAIYEIGISTGEDVDQIKYAMLQAKNAKRSAEIQRDNAMVMLKLAMNYPFDKDLQITEDSEDLMGASNLSLSGDVNNNIQLQILTKQQKLNQYALKNERYAHLPSLNSFFQQGYNAYRNDFNFFNKDPWFSQTLVGLQLNIPIFSGGQRHYKVQQAKISVMKTNNEITMLKQGLQAQELQLKNNMLGAVDKYQLQVANRDLAQRLYNNALLKRNIGSVTSLEVTQKYNQYVVAQAELMGSKVDVLSSKLELEKLYNKLLTNNK